MIEVSKSVSFPRSLRALAVVTAILVGLASGDSASSPQEKAKGVSRPRQGEPVPTQPPVEPEEQRTAYQLSGIAKRQQGRYREAIDDLTIYVHGNERDPDGHWELGFAWALYNDARPSQASRRRAIDAFKKCYELSPSYQRGLPSTMKASVADIMKQGRKEAGVVGDEVRRSSFDAEGLLRLAETQVDSGDLLEAKRNYDDVKALPPPPSPSDRERVRSKLDRTFREKILKIQSLENSNMQLAQNEAASLLRFFPDEPIALETYVRLQTRYSKLAMEGIVGQKIFATFRNSIDGFMMKGQYRDALSDVNRMLFNFPRAEFGERKYAEITQKNEQALAAAEEAYKAGRLEEARRKFEEIRRDYPDPGPAQDAISEIDEARRKLESGLDREQERGNAAAAYAVAKELAAKFPSTPRAQEAVKAGLADVSSQIVAGKSAVAAGRTKEAIDAFRKALAVVPEQSEAKAELGKVRATLREAKKKLWTDVLPVAAGQYIQGSNEYLDSKPKNKNASLNEFFLDRYKVTNASYRIFAAATGAKGPETWKGGEMDPVRSDYAVAGVSFAEADSYCRWLGKRLPTEFEWEKAARGATGLDTPYADAPSKVRKAYNPFGDYPVGQWPDLASPFHVEGMLSNTFDWTSSWFGPYSSNDDAPGRRVPAQTVRVLRGGARSPARPGDGDPLEVTWRERRRPEARDVDLSFRCASGSGTPPEWIDTEAEPEKVSVAEMKAVPPAAPPVAIVPAVTPR